LTIIFKELVEFETDFNSRVTRVRDNLKRALREGLRSKLSLKAQK